MAIEKQKLILISGLVLGAVAIFMVKMTIDQQQQVAKDQTRKAIATMQANQSAILVAKQDIPKGSLIDPNMLDTAIIPSKFVQPQAASSLDRVSGMVVVAPISKGEQITLSKLTNTKNAGGGDLAGITPAGKRAISIAVDNIALLGGMVKPGDYVDIIALMQIPVQGPDGQQVNQVVVYPLFQNVLVLAVGQNTGGIVSQGSRYATTESSNVSGPPLVTVALSSQDASFMAFVQEQGKIRLTLRSPADAKVESTIPANWNSLFQYLMPQQQPVSDKKSVAVEVEQGPTVEIYRGLNKERVPLSK